MWGRIPVFDDPEGGGEDAGLDYLEFYRVGGDVLVVVVFRGISIVSLQGVGELAADGHPFGGFEVIVLKEEH